MAKDLIGKYLWLIETILRNRLTFREIRRRYIDSSIREEGCELSLKTFMAWKRGINRRFSINIKCRRLGENSYYYIDNPEILRAGDVRKFLIDLQISNELHHNLQILTSATKAQRALRLTLLSGESFTLYPFSVTLEQCLWSVLGLDPDGKCERRVQLSHIAHIENLQRGFQLSFDFAT